MTANSDNCDNAIEMLERKPSTSVEDLEEMMTPEFQLVIENYTAAQDSKNNCDVIVRSSEDGYLHSEVGIDRELERLLAENPGLFMDDHSKQHQLPPPGVAPPPPSLPPPQSLLSTDTGTIHESLTLHVSKRYLNMSYFASFGCMYVCAY